MEKSLESAAFDLIYAIVNSGAGSKVLHIAKRCGISGGAIFMGKGTIKKPLLEKLALCDIRKEIVMMVAESEMVFKVLEEMNKELRLNRPNHGIAFSIPVIGVCGSRSCKCNNPGKREGMENNMYRSVIIIVDKGKGEAVVEAAAKAGSTGATIINARGSGVHETSRLFAMEVEPEKEIVLMITKSDQTDVIVSSIRDNFKIDKPGNGIIFVQDVNRVYGLTE